MFPFRVRPVVGNSRLAPGHVNRSRASHEIRCSYAVRVCAVKVAKTLSCLKGPAAMILGFVWKVLCCLLPLYQKLFVVLHQVYVWAPKKLAQMVFGAVLAFFGGTYVASLAAIEAFRTMGGERLWADLVYGALPLHKPSATLRCSASASWRSMASCNPLLSCSACPSCPAFLGRAP